LRKNGNGSPKDEKRAANETVYSPLLNRGGEDMKISIFMGISPSAILFLSHMVTEEPKKVKRM